MDCRHIDFSPSKSEERINRALRVFPQEILLRLLVFALHLLGVQRKDLAALVDMPDESVKTVVRLALRDGFAALRDRRRSKGPSVTRASPSPLRISARREGDWVVVDFGPHANQIKIPLGFRVQARTVLLSFVNAGLLSVRESATILGLCDSHCRELAHKLATHDVVESLIDKRQGQQQDYRVGPEQKAEIIQQLAARAITGHSTSSEDVAKVVNERTQAKVSSRTIRWHIHKLGLTHIKETLLPLVELLKKSS